MTTVPNLPKFIALQKESSVEIIEEQPCDKMMKDFYSRRRFKNHMKFTTDTNQHSHAHASIFD
jgi:hypothetical protein